MTATIQLQNLLASRPLFENVKIKMYKTINVHVVLYGCETWSLILKEDHRQRVFEKRVLRGIFGPRNDEIMGGWRKLHNDGLYNFTLHQILLE
jgi:hypothetical protein